MDNDNPGRFLNADDMHRRLHQPNEDGEDWKPVRLYAKELFKKSIEIYNLTEVLCDLLQTMPDKDSTDTEDTIRLMRQNAMLVPAKIRGAMAMDDVYSLIMENAVIIKVNICELRNQLHACNYIHNVEKRYTDVLRQAIEEFRGVFVQWVDSFDRSNDHPDEWHLFNKPGDFPEE